MASTVISPGNTRQRLLEYAAAKLGRREVARRLKVTEAKLEEWMDGEGHMPATKLGALADLIDSIGKAEG